MAVFKNQLHFISQIIKKRLIFFLILFLALIFFGRTAYPILPIEQLFYGVNIIDEIHLPVEWVIYFLLPLLLILNLWQELWEKRGMVLHGLQVSRIQWEWVNIGFIYLLSFLTWGIMIFILSIISLLGHSKGYPSIQLLTGILLVNIQLLLWQKIANFIHPIAGLVLPSLWLCLTVITNSSWNFLNIAMYCRPISNIQWISSIFWTIIFTWITMKISCYCDY